MMSPQLLLWPHAATTLALTGLIWFVQIVHYPLFSRVGEEGFADYAAAHQRRTGLVVVPLMLAEAVCAVLVVALGLGPRAWTLAGLALLASIWLSTAVIQMPIHRRLLAGRSLPLVRRLVAGNWLRTAAWTARSGVALALLAEAS